MKSYWRLAAVERADTAFDGEGARLYGGRWNSQGVSMVYASESRALAVLEILVHLDTPARLRPMVLFEIGVPDEWVIDAASARTREWVTALSIRPETRRVGDQWVRSGQSVACRVPSAVIPEEHNLLLNPGHADFTKLRISEAVVFSLDPRFTASSPQCRNRK